MHKFFRRACFLLVLTTLVICACRMPQHGRDSADNDVTTSMLNQTLPSVSMEPNPEAMFDWLSETTGIPITVEWDHVGFGRDQAFQAWPNGLTLRQYLPLLLDDLSDPADPADYAVRDGAIIVSSKRRLSR